MKSKIIFIAGVHGVGKTTLCEYLSKKLSIKSYTASSLIKKFSNVDLPNDKKVKDIQENQDILISAINEYLQEVEEFVLDGHFCLLDKSGAITKVPSTTFEEIKPIAIVCLYNVIDTISQRLKSRDDRYYDRGLLNDLQEEEKAYSKEISTNLEVPYFLGMPDEDKERILAFISDAIKEN